MSTTVNTLLTVAATLALAGPAAADTPAAGDVAKHPIVLTRPHHVGQKLHVTAEGSLEVESVTDFGGPQTMNKLIYVQLEGDAEVLGIDRNAQPTKLAYTVTKCEHTVNGYKSAIAPAGSVLTAERRADDETYFTLNGRPLDESATESLRVVARLDDESLTHDELAGSPTPKAPGETWPIDVEATMAALQGKGGPPISADNVTGTMKFWEPTEHSNVPCVIVDTEFAVTGWLEKMTPGFELENAEFTAMIRGLYPTDETLPVLAESERLTIDTVMVGSPFGGDSRMEVHLVVKQRVERQVTPIGVDAVAAVED